MQCGLEIVAIYYHGYDTPTILPTAFHLSLHMSYKYKHFFKI